MTDQTKQRRWMMIKHPFVKNSLLFVGWGNIFADQDTVVQELFHQYTSKPFYEIGSDYIILVNSIIIGSSKSGDFTFLVATYYEFSTGLIYCQCRLSPVFLDSRFRYLNPILS